MNMRAAVLQEYGKFEWKEVSRPEPKDNEVLVKITYGSICGTDQHIFTGEFHPRTTLPFIPGHEFAGTVEKVGPKVTEFHPGDKVAIDPIIWCGLCPACLKGHYPACSTLKLLGVDLNGGFAEYISVRQEMLYSVPPDIPNEHAALIEVLAIGFHACNRAQLKQADTAVIWGTGKIGHSILQAARIKTDNTIFLVDILDNRLKLASDHFDNVVPINPLKEDPIEKILERTKGRGVDVAFEAVGHPGSALKTINPVRGCIQAIRGGGTVCVLGLSDEPAPIVFKELIWKEAKIVCSRVSHGEFAEVIEHLKTGKLQPEILISKILPGREIQTGFELLEKDPANYLKILIDFQN